MEGNCYPFFGEVHEWCGYNWDGKQMALSASKEADVIDVGG